MELNAPTLPAEHPINRVTPNFTCPKCKKENALARALQYGQGDSFHGKVYHWCAKTPECRGVRVYTPPPDVPPPAAFYPPYYPPGFPPGFPGGFPPLAVGGQQPGVPGAPPAMGWHFPPGFPVPPFGPWAAQVLPGAAAQAPAPAPQNPQTLTCTGPLCTSGSNGRQMDGNRACALKMCKKDCLATLMSYERAARSHDGCNATGHRRAPFRADGDASQAPAQSASPPIDPVLPPAMQALAPTANSAAAASASTAAPASAAATSSLAVSKPSISRSLELNWGTIGQSQARQQQLALSARRQRVATAKQPTVTVHLWHQDGEPCVHFEVPVASLACFSLAIDASAFLNAAGIDADMFERYDFELDAWVMVSPDASIPVTPSQRLLYRVHKVKVCDSFETFLATARGNSAAASSAASQSLQRLGEAATSPPVRKRARSPSPSTTEPVQPIPHTPHSRARDSRSVSAAPTRNNDIDIIFSPSPPRARTESAVSFKIHEDNQSFPGDFYFCDIVAALEQSAKLAKARKKLRRTGQAITRAAVLSELLRTNVPASTLGDIDRKLTALQNEQPNVYREFLGYGQTAKGLYSSFKARCQRDRRPHKRAKTTPSVSPPPESGSVNSPIDVDTFNETLSPHPQSLSLRPLSPLSLTIKTLEEEQEILRPPLPVDVAKLPATLDWDEVTARAERLVPSLNEIIANPLEHVFCQDLRAAFRAKKNGKLSLTQRVLVTDFVHAGYYGPNGLGLAIAMTRHLTNVNLYSEDALSNIRPMTTDIFVDRVLVRELILKLMQEDFGLSPDDTALLYERSKWFGDQHHPADDDDDEDMDESAPLKPRTAAEHWFLRRAMEQNRKLQETGDFL